jgi:superfamily II DNA or RNA helicase
MRVELREFQNTAVSQVKDAMRQGFRAPLVVLPTGSGKTVLFCHLGEQAALRGNFVLILVHRQELLNQTSRHLDRLGLPHGLIAPGHSMTGDHMQIASVRTIVRRLDRLNFYPSLIIIDEAHHSNAGSWRKILDHFSKSFILGVTATPMRMDGSGLGVKSGGFYDCMIEGPTVAELTRLGFLAPAVVYRPPLPADLSGIPMRGHDFDTEKMAFALDKPTITGCAIEHYKRICPGAPAIAFCSSVKHAEHVADNFNQAGIPAASLDGTMSDDIRKYRINALATGGIQVLTSCDIISEGTDIPVVTTAILLRRTMSLGLFLQQVGRCLRPHPNKTNSIILDHVGNVFLHGFPDDEREWSLDVDQKKKKKKKTGEAEIALRQCQNCFAMFRPPRVICPQCGAGYKVTEREIQQVDGELVEVKKTENMYEKINRRFEQARAQSLDDLIAIAKARGYSKQWAYIIHNQRKQKEEQRQREQGSQVRMAI